MDHCCNTKDREEMEAHHSQALVLYVSKWINLYILKLPGKILNWQLFPMNREQKETKERGRACWRGLYRTGGPTRVLTYEYHGPLKNKLLKTYNTNLQYIQTYKTYNTNLIKFLEFFLFLMQFLESL